VGEFPGFELPSGPPPGLDALARAMGHHLRALFRLVPPGVAILVHQKGSPIMLPGRVALPPLLVTRPAVTMDVELAERASAGGPPPLPPNEPSGEAAVGGS
jgi:hypothetical protein